MNIAATDAASGDLDEEFAGSRRRLGQIEQLQVLIFAKQQRFHCIQCATLGLSAAPAQAAAAADSANPEHAG